MGKEGSIGGTEKSQTDDQIVDEMVAVLGFNRRASHSIIQSLECSSGSLRDPVVLTANRIHRGSAIGGEAQP
jgi:hypothetical protein